MSFNLGNLENLQLYNKNGHTLDGVLCRGGEEKIASLIQKYATKMLSNDYFKNSATLPIQSGAENTLDFDISSKMITLKLNGQTRTIKLNGKRSQPSKGEAASETQKLIRSINQIYNECLSHHSPVTVPPIHNREIRHIHTPYPTRPGYRRNVHGTYGTFGHDSANTLTRRNHSARSTRRHSQGSTTSSGDSESDSESTQTSRVRQRRASHISLGLRRRPRVALDRLRIPSGNTSPRRNPRDRTSPHFPLLSPSTSDLVTIPPFTPDDSAALNPLRISSLEAIAIPSASLTASIPPHHVSSTTDEELFERLKFLAAYAQTFHAMIEPSSDDTIDHAVVHTDIQTQLQNLADNHKSPGPLDTVYFYLYHLKKHEFIDEQPEDWDIGKNLFSRNKVYGVTCTYEDIALALSLSTLQTLMHTFSKDQNFESSIEAYNQLPAIMKNRIEGLIWQNQNRIENEEIDYGKRAFEIAHKDRFTSQERSRAISMYLAEFWNTRKT